MARRTLWMLVALALIVASCDTDAGTTTTTEPADTTTTTMAPTAARAALQANGPPIVGQGDSGPFVEAVQFYLVCMGLGQPDADGPMVSVDGSFGPITAYAVAYFQAQVRRAPSGAPDDETFAMMARECRDPRTFSFPIGESTTEFAGNAASGDDEVFTFTGMAGQILALSALEGSVEISIEDEEGSTLATGANSVQIDLPGAGDFTVRVAATSPTSFRIQAEVRSPNVLVTEFGPMALRGDGAGVAEFGGGAVNAAAVIALLLGNPWEDSGWRSDVAACPGTHQAVTWLIQAGLGSDRHPAVFIAYFAEVSNEPIFLQYSYHTLDLAALDPLAQGLATRDGISLGHTLADYIDAYGETTLDGNGRATTPDGVTVEFQVVGDNASPDPDASRIRSIGAGNGGCEDL